VGAINQVWEERYYMVRLPDDTWCITKGSPIVNSPILKSGLTEKEANAYLKLLKEV
jgi:hypothetical protein